MDTPVSKTLVVLLLGLILTGCSSRLQPDLARLYSNFARTPEDNPVILIPGTMGSTLVDEETGNQVWPGGLMNFVTGSSIDELRLPVSQSTLNANDDTLEPKALFSRIAGRNYYGRIVETLSEIGGYDCVVASEITAETNCVLFPWDWRRDIVESTKKLDNLIDELRSLKGDPNLKADVIAHSAGGLLTRYYVRYGSRDVLDQDGFPVTFEGAKKLRKVALVATPNFGSIPALQRAVMGQEIGFTSIPPETLATMPGLYQTLPHPDRTFMIDVHGRKVERDLYNIDVWEDYEWSIFRPDIRDRIKDRFNTTRNGKDYLRNFENQMDEYLRRARNFHRSLSQPMEKTPVKYIVFGSSCILTPSVCLVEEVEGKRKVRLFPEQVVNRKPGVNYEELMLAPGDGTVTKASLLARENLAALADPASGDFPIDYSVFICEQHATYPSNVTFQDNLLNILLY